MKGPAMKHTPTPWKAFNKVNKEGKVLTKPDYIEWMNAIWDATKGDKKHFIAIETDEKVICLVGCGPQGPANAKFICLAVNNHDKLLEACKVALSAVEDNDTGHIWVNHPEKPEKTPISILKEAIADVEKHTT
jgi:hypothetical protein